MLHWLPINNNCNDSSVGESKGLREANCTAGQLWQRWTARSQPAPPRTCSSNRDLRRRRPLGESLRTWALDRSSRSDTRAQPEDRTHVWHWQLSDLKKIQMLGEMWLLYSGDYFKWERFFLGPLVNFATPDTIASNIQVIMSELGRPCFTDMFEKLFGSTIAKPSSVN